MGIPCWRDTQTCPATYPYKNQAIGKESTLAITTNITISREKQNQNAWTDAQRFSDADFFHALQRREGG